jgi:hypothetical protein
MHIYIYSHKENLYLFTQRKIYIFYNKVKRKQFLRGEWTL